MTTYTDALLTASHKKQRALNDLIAMQKATRDVPDIIVLSKNDQIMLSKTFDQQTDMIVSLYEIIKILTGRVEVLEETKHRKRTTL